MWSRGSFGVRPGFKNINGCDTESADGSEASEGINVCKHSFPAAGYEGIELKVKRYLPGPPPFSPIRPSPPCHAVTRFDPPGGKVASRRRNEIRRRLVGMRGGLSPEARPREGVAVGAVALGPVVDQVLVAGEAERPCPGDIADAGGGGVMAAGAGTTEVRVARMGGGRGLVVALDAAHVGLVVSGVAARAVGLGRAEGQATGVAGGALDLAVGVVIEGQ
jgi:hypothetical protein